MHHTCGKRLSLPALLLATLACSAAGVESRQFTLSVDRTQWSKWGFEYPATYVFGVEGLTADAAVKHRAAPTDAWRRLAERTSAEFFNGLECVRFDRPGKRAYVSVGFRVAPTLTLEFTGAASAQFLGVARYYDDRRACYTLSIDNWGRQATANPGAPWHGAEDDRSDKYQAAVRVCRGLNLPVTVAINSRMAGGETMWATMQQELDRHDASWEPATHGRTHPGSAPAFQAVGYQPTIIGCRDDLLEHLHGFPYGQRVFTHILTSGYCDSTLLDTDAGQFLFLRGYTGHDDLASTEYAAWDSARRFYGVGGLQTKDYDTVLRRHKPLGRFCAADVAELNAAFDKVVQAGGIVYAMWHPDRYQNSVIHDPRVGRDGAQGSTLMQHLKHVALRKDLWYTANGWLYGYRWVAENVAVSPR